MAKVSLKQKIKLFKDEDFTGVQAVTLETDPEKLFLKAKKQIAKN